MSESARWTPDLPVEPEPVYQAWQREFERQGLPYRALPGSVRNGDRDAVARHGEREAKLDQGARHLGLSLWAGSRGRLYAPAPDVATAAAVAGLWLSGARPVEMAKAWPFLGSVALAEAVEGEDPIEIWWRRLYENRVDEPRAVRVADFIQLAFHEPRLRSKWPVFSHYILHFRGGGENALAVEPTRVPGRYRVLAHGRRIVAETDAAGALRLVLESLPE